MSHLPSRAANPYQANWLHVAEPSGANAKPHLGAHIICRVLCKIAIR